jgi:mRNA deadenylase 3'-5' endonuclease subunit Ccr4
VKEERTRRSRQSSTRAEKDLKRFECDFLCLQDVNHDNYKKKGGRKRQMKDFQLS